MRFLIFLLVALLTLGLGALAVADDYSGEVSLLQETGRTLPSVIVNIPDVLEVTTVGIIAERQPVQRVVKRVGARKPLRNLIDRFRGRNRRPVRKLLLR